MKLRSHLGSFVIVLSVCGGASAQITAWDEASNGDLSNNGISPTPVTFVVGANQVRGTTGNAGQGVDRDYFNFTVPQGAELKSLRLLANTSVSGSVSFIAIQAGPQVTVSPTGAGVENLLGFAHYGNDLVGTDILPSVVRDFTGMLPHGTYSIWIQETGGPAEYEFEFGLSPAATAAADVPTLPEWGVLLMSLLLLGSMWWHRRLQ